MRADSALGVLLCPSPNHGARDARLAIDMLLLHYTGMPDADGALKWLCMRESEVSAHYFVYEDGHIVQLVPEARRAWHAGAAFWAGERDINGCSIGIEIANEGPESADPEFPEAQMLAVISLCRDIMRRHGIPARRVLGHSDVAPGRKVDPGPFFDWQRLAASGIGLWPQAAPVTGGALRVGDSGEEVTRYQRALADFGYQVAVSGEFCEHTQAVTKALQLHFRSWRVYWVAVTATRGLAAALAQESAEG